MSVCLDVCLLLFNSSGAGAVGQLVAVANPSNASTTAHRMILAGDPPRPVLTPLSPFSTYRDYNVNDDYNYNDV